MRLALLAIVVLLQSCPGGQGQSGKQPQNTPAASVGSVTLLRTDLGLADGALVRDADAALAELARDGRINYAPVGELPGALQTEGGTGDVGLPGVEAAGSARAVGTMTLAEAGELAKQLKSADVLVLSSPLAYRAVKPLLADGTLKFGSIVLLDGEGPPLAAEDAARVQTIQYDVREAAYLVGVAASVSSRSQAFVAFTSDQDPNAAEFLQAVEDGIHNRMRGGNVYHAQLSPDDEGIVAPEHFRGALLPLIQGIQTDHYIVAAGRATPSIMYALSSDPTDGYILGGYGDFRQVRPARIVCCVVKRPGVVLRELFAGVESAGDLQSALKARLGRRYGLREGAVDVTDLKAYAKFNQDAEDIADAVDQVRGEILAGELVVVE